MAPHSSTLAWKIPWMEEPGRLQSMGSLRVRHGRVTTLSLFTFMRWRRKWQPTPVFLPGESQGRGSLMGCRHGVAQSRTRLKRPSSSSSSGCHGDYAVAVFACGPVCRRHSLLSGLQSTQVPSAWNLFSELFGRLVPTPSNLSIIGLHQQSSG